MQKYLQQQAIEYASKAIAIASAHPYAGAPKVANYVLIQALANVGRVAEAKQLSNNLFGESASGLHGAIRLSNFSRHSGLESL